MPIAQLFNNLEGATDLGLPLLASWDPDFALSYQNLSPNRQKPIVPARRPSNEEEQHPYLPITYVDGQEVANAITMGKYRRTKLNQALILKLIGMSGSTGRICI